MPSLSAGEFLPLPSLERKALASEPVSRNCYSGGESLVPGDLGFVPSQRLKSLEKRQFLEGKSLSRAGTPALLKRGPWPHIPFFLCSPPQHPREDRGLILVLTSAAALKFWWGSWGSRAVRRTAGHMFKPSRGQKSIRSEGRGESHRQQQVLSFQQRHLLRSKGHSQGCCFAGVARLFFFFFFELSIPSLCFLCHWWPAFASR